MEAKGFEILGFGGFVGSAGEIAHDFEGIFGDFFHPMIDIADEAFLL
jgi:hypothetical protein